MTDTQAELREKIARALYEKHHPDKMYDTMGWQACAFFDRVRPSKDGESE